MISTRISGRAISACTAARAGLWAKDFSKLIYEAKKIYDAHRVDLEKDCTEEEFMAMYEQYEAFDDLEEKYMEDEELITAQIAEYVDEHVEYFAVIG